MKLNTNCLWCKDILEKLEDQQPIDTICTFPASTNWLITKLAKAGIPFKIYNMGGSIKRITTDTTTCPCCKKPL